jgi:hypothetical protein
MRVSTSQIYQSSTDAMGTSASRTQQAQQRISSGVRITAVSQDATAVTQASRLQQVMAESAVFTANVDELDMRHAEADQSLSVVHDALGRLSALLTSARNGAMQPRDRAAIGASVQAEVQTIQAELQRRDSQGRPLYNGGVADEAHPALLVRPGQAVSTEIPLGQALQDRLAALSAATWASGAGMAASTDADRSAALVEVQALQSSALGARQVVGGRWEQLSRAQDASLAVSDSAEMARSALVDTDVARTATDLATYTAQLQAARAMFSRIQSTSLFDTIR